MKVKILDLHSKSTRNQSPPNPQCETTEEDKSPFVCLLSSFQEGSTIVAQHQIALDSNPDVYCSPSPFIPNVRAKFVSSKLVCDDNSVATKIQVFLVIELQHASMMHGKAKNKHGRNYEKLARRGRGRDGVGFSGSKDSMEIDY